MKTVGSAGDLMALASRVERYEVTGPYDIARDRERDINEAVAAAVGVPATVKVGHEILGNLRAVPTRLPAYTASLDAAMTLVPQGWRIGTLAQGRNGSCYATLVNDEWAAGDAATLALALTAACLRAHAAGAAA